MKQIGTYILYNKNTGENYVGSTGDFRNRILRHFRELNSGNHHNKKLQEVWDKDPDFDCVLYETGTVENARKLEESIIVANERNEKLLNIGRGVKGGDNLTRNPDKSAIVNKMTSSILKRNASFTNEDRIKRFSRKGEKNGMFGRTHTEEAKDRISKANLGITRRSGFKLSDDHVEKIRAHARTRTGERNPFYGRTHTEEFKALLRERMLGSQPANMREVSIGGKVYISINDASRKLGISSSLLSHRLRSKLPKYSDYNYVDKSQTTIETASTRKRE